MSNVLTGPSRATTVPILPFEVDRPTARSWKPPFVEMPLEFIKLFHAISAMNTQDQPYVLQFVGSIHGEGASTVARNFAMVAASHCTKPTLLVNCAPPIEPPDREPLPGPSLIDAFCESGTIAAAIQPTPDFPNVGLARLSAAENARLNIDAADLRRLFELLKQTFPIIVLDCPPTTESPESLALVRYCDGTVLVVRAETTPRSVIAETKDSVEHFGGRIVGVVLNRCKSYLPRWLRRWL